MSGFLSDFVNYTQRFKTMRNYIGIVSLLSDFMWNGSEIAHSIWQIAKKASDNLMQWNCRFYSNSVSFCRVCTNAVHLWIHFYCKFGYFREGFIFVKIKSSRNGKITLSFIYLGKPWPSREILMSQLCLLTVFTKVKVSRKFPDLRYQCSAFHVINKTGL